MQIKLPYIPFMNYSRQGLWFSTVLTIAAVLLARRTNPLRRTRRREHRPNHERNGERATSRRTRRQTHRPIQSRRPIQRRTRQQRPARHRPRLHRHDHLPRPALRMEIRPWRRAGAAARRYHHRRRLLAHGLDIRPERAGGTARHPRLLGERHRRRL